MACTSCGPVCNTVDLAHTIRKHEMVIDIWPNVKR